MVNLPILGVRLKRPVHAIGKRSKRPKPKLITECKIYKNNDLIFDKLKAEIIITRDENGDQTEWHGSLYCTVHQGLFFPPFTNDKFKIELSNGKSSEFLINQKVFPVAIQGLGTLE